MKIGYFVTACNEFEELTRLLLMLKTNISNNDCIGILLDEDTYTKEVQELCERFVLPDNSIRIGYASLNNDFATFKNTGYELLSDCDWIFQIDADELPSSTLMDNLHEIIDMNPTIDLIYIPRINTVEGLTNEHVKKWGWNVNNEGWVNWPDYQGRIYKRDKQIKWQGKVHERIVGIKNLSQIPPNEQLALHHPKTIDRQEQQNKYYETI
tara:strand:+ start:3713 stop:4342 length:630 start_codon:yes stop_codon:yes gene_type:complete